MSYLIPEIDFVLVGLQIDVDSVGREGHGQQAAGVTAVTVARASTVVLLDRLTRQVQ